MAHTIIFQFSNVFQDEMWCTDSSGISAANEGGAKDEGAVMFLLIRKTRVHGPGFFFRTSTPLLNLPSGDQLVYQYQVKIIGSRVGQVYRNWIHFICVNDTF